jgi:hypothetical protein
MALPGCGFIRWRRMSACAFGALVLYALPIAEAAITSQEAPIQVPPEVPPARMTPLPTDRRIQRKLRRINGARERTRTSTPLRELAPEASASANSATRAMCVAKLRG